MIRPANKGLTIQRQRVSEKTRKLAELEKAASDAEELRIQLEQLQNAIGALENKLPFTSEIGKMLEQVTMIAQKQGLKPKTIRTRPQKNSSGYVEQPIRMELEGDFNSFYSFLLELEKLSRIIKIRHLDLRKLQSVGSQSVQGWVTADFVVSIFFQSS